MSDRSTLPIPGMVAVATSATISATACTLLACYVSFLFYKGRSGGQWAEEVEKRTRFLKTDFGILFLNLIISDFLQAIGFAMTFHWVKKRSIDENDPVCTFQAVAIQLGDVGSAAFALDIAVHTCCILAFRYKPPKWAVRVTTILSWSLSITLAVIGPTALAKNGRYYGDAGAWCWVKSSYQDLRLWLHYFFIFISMFGSAILYTMCGLAVLQIWPFNRNQTIINRISVSQQTSTSMSSSTNEDQNLKVTDIPSFSRLTRTARKMIVYPLIFTTFVLPLSAYRLAGITGHQGSLEVLCFCGFMYSACGTADVITFSLTRHLIDIKRRHPFRSDPSSSGPTTSGIYVHRVETTISQGPDDFDMKRRQGERTWKQSVHSIDGDLERNEADHDRSRYHGSAPDLPLPTPVHFPRTSSFLHQ